MNKIIMISKNQAGASIAQVVVAAGMMGVMALGIMKLSKQQLEGSARMETSYEIAAIQSEVQAILSHPSNCKKSFEGEVVNPFNSTTASTKDRIKKKHISGSFKDKFIVGKGYGQGNIKINSYGISFTADPTNINEALLVIQFDRGKAVGKRTTVNKRIPLEVTVDSNNKIETCFAKLAGVATIWKRMGPPDDKNIFFDEEHVGIGTANPNVLLHLEAKIMQPALYIFTESDPAVPASPTGIRFKNRTSNTPQDYNLSVSHDNNFKIQRGGHPGTADFSVAPNGNVGIGTADAKAQLHIKGPMMVGFDTTCDSNTKGKLRYNGTIDKMEYCSSTGWQTMKGTATKCATAVKAQYVSTMVDNHTGETKDNIFQFTVVSINCKSGFFMVTCNSASGWGGSSVSRLPSSTQVGMLPPALEVEACFLVSGPPQTVMRATCCRNE